MLEPPTIIFYDFTLKIMFFENFSAIFRRGLRKGRLGNSLFFMAQNGEFGSIAPCASITLYSLKLCIKAIHKGRRPLSGREFQENSIQTHAFESLCRSLWREQHRGKYAVTHCGTATNHYKNKEFNHT